MFLMILTHLAFKGLSATSWYFFFNVLCNVGRVFYAVLMKRVEMFLFLQSIHIFIYFRALSDKNISKVLRNNNTLATGIWLICDTSVIRSDSGRDRSAVNGLIFKKKKKKCNKSLNCWWLHVMWLSDFSLISTKYSSLCLMKASKSN